MMYSERQPNTGMSEIELVNRIMPLLLPRVVLSSHRYALTAPKPEGVSMLRTYRSQKELRRAYLLLA